MSRISLDPLSTQSKQKANAEKRKRLRVCNCKGNFSAFFWFTHGSPQPRTLSANCQMTDMTWDNPHVPRRSYQNVKTRLTQPLRWKAFSRKVSHKTTTVNWTGDLCNNKNCHDQSDKQWDIQIYPTDQSPSDFYSSDWTIIPYYRQQPLVIKIKTHP